MYTICKKRISEVIIPDNYETAVFQFDNYDFFKFMSWINNFIVEGN